MARSIFRECVVSIFVTVFGAVLLSGAGVLPARAQSAGGTTASGVSNALNPAISLNGLFLGTWSDPAADLDGFKIQEVELAMTSVVDPYFKANANVSFSPNRAGPGADVSLEEAYALFTSLPAGWGLRAGRFLMPFGRHNQLHTHAFPFAEAPRSVATILGPDSQSDVGLELSYAPLVPWYLNLRAYAGDGGTEDVFDGDSKELAEGGRIENLWDLSDATTFEAAASYANGPDSEGGRKQLWGVDFRVKNRDPRRAQGRAWEGVVEILGAAPEIGPDQTGIYAFLRTRMKRRFWLGAGADFLSTVPDSIGNRDTEHEIKGQVAFIPSEFSAVRVDLGWRDHPDAERELFAQCQFNFTIGSHPAHTY